MHACITKKLFLLENFNTLFLRYNTILIEIKKTLTQSKNALNDDVFFKVKMYFIVKYNK